MHLLSPLSISILALVAVIGLWQCARLAGWTGAGGPESARQLFNRLCRAHRLRRNDQSLLWRVAREQYPQNPLQLFLEPDSLRLPKLKVMRRVESDRLAAVAKQLYGDFEAEAARAAVAKSRPVPPTPLRAAAPPAGIDVGTLVNTPAPPSNAVG
jgi:hypothetical protein